MADLALVRIALADDHNLVRKGLAQLLDGTDGFAVVATAGDGKSLLEKLQQLKEPPTVCLLDMNMPNGGGYEALLLLKEHFPELRFIILSMLDHEMLVLKMFRAGASGYILKEQDPEELIQAIWTVAAGGYCFFKEMNTRMMRSLQSDAVMKQKTLTAKQEQFLALVCTGLPNKSIATEMNVQENTVDGYREALFEKFKVNSRVELALVAIALGLYTPGQASK